MKRYIVILTLLFVSSIGQVRAQNVSEFLTEADTFFKTHVKNGRVDYKAISENPDGLNALVEKAKTISVDKSNTEEYQAFWINGYNLTVIKGIVDNYPTKSPMNIGGFFDGKKREIGGEKITLNDIENKLLRKNFPDEPRFHFVLVCGALGCPPIIDEAYMPDTLDAQLEKQTKMALNDPEFIRVNKNKVKISQIFEWYTEDFTRGDQTLVGYINKYKTDKLPEDAKVSYYQYDWTLNNL